MKNIFFAIVLGSCLMGCISGDETHILSDNNDSEIYVNIDDHEGCWTCFESIQPRDGWVDNKDMCEGSAEIRRVLQDCATPINACQGNFVNDKPMINNCLEVLMHTSLCNEKFFNCVLDEGSK